MQLTSRSLGSLYFIGSVAVACTPEQACDCATSGVTIIAARGNVVAISTSGTACRADAWLCVSTNDRTALVGCEQWLVQPAGEGTCRIDVSLSDGSTRSADFQITNRGAESCCSGLYANGDGTFVVPGPDAGSPDAGP